MAKPPGVLAVLNKIRACVVLIKRTLDEYIVDYNETVTEQRDSLRRIEKALGITRED